MVAERTHTTDCPQSPSPEGAWKIIKGYTVQIGLLDVKPHDLRCLAGTELARKNPRVGQFVLGHASIETFYKHYVLDEIPEDATEGSTGTRDHEPVGTGLAGHSRFL